MSAVISDDEATPGASTYRATLGPGRVICVSGVAPGNGGTEVNAAIVSTSAWLNARSAAERDGKLNENKNKRQKREWYTRQCIGSWTAGRRWSRT